MEARLSHESHKTALVVALILFFILVYNEVERVRTQENGGSTSCLDYHFKVPRWICLIR